MRFHETPHLPQNLIVIIIRYPLFLFFFFFFSFLEMIAEGDQDYGAHVLIIMVGNRHTQDCPRQVRMSVTLVKVAHMGTLR